MIRHDMMYDMMYNMMYDMISRSAFPDEEIKVIVKEEGAQGKDTNFFTNWLGG